MRDIFACTFLFKRNGKSKNQIKDLDENPEQDVHTEKFNCIKS